MVWSKLYEWTRRMVQDNDINSWIIDENTILAGPAGTQNPVPTKIIDILDPDISKVSAEERSLRLEICKKCEFLDKTFTCLECSCFMLAKTWLFEAQCPIEKW